LLPQKERVSKNRDSSDQRQCPSTLTIKKELEMKTYTAAIIGAGSIGALKPEKYDSPEGTEILTHAHACHAHSRINLIGIVDTYKEKANLAADKWNCIGLTDLLELPFFIDIIIVATPTEKHAETLSYLLQLSPRLVIAEKPFTENGRDAKMISGLYEKENIPIAINYIRRYVPEYVQIKKIIDEKQFGKVLNCFLLYTRGLKREASHAIDLFNYFFGDFIDGSIINDNSIDDYSSKDRTYAAYLSYDCCRHIFMFPCDGRQFAIFEMDLIFERGRIKLTNHGIMKKYYKTKKEEIYDDTNILDPLPYYSCKTHLTEGLTLLLDNVVDFLDDENHSGSLLCSDKDALKVHEIYEKLGV
jgi:predicted dehydrogenase